MVGVSTSSSCLMKSIAAAHRFVPANYCRSTSSFVQQQLHRRCFHSAHIAPSASSSSSSALLSFSALSPSFAAPASPSRPPSCTSSTAVTTTKTTTTMRMNRDLVFILRMRDNDFFGTCRRGFVTVTKTNVSSLPQPPPSSKEDGEEEVVVTMTHDTGTLPPTYHSQMSDSMIVTPSCLKRVEALIKQRRAKEMAATEENPMENNPYFLRVYVDSGGCSGFEYKFELDNELDDEEDHVIVSRKDDENGEERSPRVVVDETSLGFLKGATLDYVVEMIKSSFVVRDNPQSESACGCGSSFAVKNFSANPARD